MSRIALASIPSLTLYKDEFTTGRRTRPVPQLICDGAPCARYTPDVVRCTNAGGRGAHIDWTCRAELPDSMRLGRVEVSCEGFDAPGDPYVLEGSCSLKYRLVRVTPDETPYPRTKSSLFSGDNVTGTVFTVLWIAVLLFIVSSFLKSYFSRGHTGTPRPPPHTGGTGGTGGTGTWGATPGGPWFPGADTDAPPPYDAHAKPSSATGPPGGWGLWTGAALGGLGTYLASQRTRERPTATQYDWERERAARRDDGAARQGGARQRAAPFRADDRGEGSSSLGAMRTSTGFGGSNVR